MFTCCFPLPVPQTEIKAETGLFWLWFLRLNSFCFRATRKSSKIEVDFEFRLTCFLLIWLFLALLILYVAWYRYSYRIIQHLFKACKLVWTNGLRARVIGFEIVFLHYFLLKGVESKISRKQISARSILRCSFLITSKVCFDTESPCTSPFSSLLSASNLDSHGRSRSYDSFEKLATTSSETNAGASSKKLD